MKITLCGSIAFYDQMLDVKQHLEKLGHEIQLPPLQVKDEQGNLISVKKYYELRKAEASGKSWIWDRKKEAMTAHFDKIVWSDAILVLNYDKNNVGGYIGANTLIEMGVALHLSKPIFLLKGIPEISYKEEIFGMNPYVINDDLALIKHDSV